MKLFDLFQKKPVQKETLDWSFLDHRLSIYKFLVEGLDDAGRLLPDHLCLPDQKMETQGRSRLMSIAGARDGYRLYHTHLKGHRRQVEEIVRDFAQAVETYDDQDLQRFYEKLVDFDLLPSLEILQDELAYHPFDPGRVFTLAAQLALHAADRQALKFALVVLSFYQIPEVRALSLLFSQHDEFTYYALLCLRNFEERLEEDSFLLAQCVYGWGRIHAVKSLLEKLDPENEEIKEWLLREGFHNTVSDSYLAKEIVSRAGLLDRLNEKTVDNGILNASAILIAALLDPQNPGEDITHVAEGTELIKAYLKHLSGNRQTHMHQPTLIRLKALLTNRETEAKDDFAKKLESLGWRHDRELVLRLAIALGDEELFAEAQDT